MATRKWSAKVDTESTYPEQGLFKQDAATIAKELASKKVSPKGPASGMRMLNFYINRAGKTLSKSRHAELEKAKKKLSEIIAAKKQKAPAKKAAKKATRKTAIKTVKKAAKKSVSKKSAKKRSSTRS